MQPNRLGRVLGVSARFAAEKLREQVDRVGAPPPQNPSWNTGATAAAEPARSVNHPRPAPGPRPQPAGSRAAAATHAQGSRRLARGAGRFGAAFVKPFAHATSVLTLQIVGLFFALFSLFFIEHSWMLYNVHRFADHHIFIYVALALLFSWFTVSSFWRARRRLK
jgi:hypothetical protein